MALLLLPVFLLSVIIGMVLTSSRRSGRVGGDDEFVHAAAVLRRQSSGAERRRERRREINRSCTACILGEEETRAACRIVDVSRSGMRIASSAQFPTAAQIIVEWGSEFFVGTICYGFPKDGENVFGLQLVSTNRGR